MKNLFSILALTISLLFLKTSCSSTANPEPNNPVPDPVPMPADNNWKLDNYIYSRRDSNQTTSVQGNFTIVSIESNVATANNPYTNCNLNITFNTSTIGSYLVKAQNTLVANSTLKYMHIRCLIASGNGTGAIYDSIDSNVSATISIVDGKFVVVIPSGVILNRVLNEGMTNPPASFTLVAQKVR